MVSVYVFLQETIIIIDFCDLICPAPLNWLVQGKLGKHINMLGFVRLKTCFSTMVSCKISRKNSPKFRRWGETSHPATGRRALAGAWDRPAALGAAAPGASPVGFVGSQWHWVSHIIDCLLDTMSPISLKHCHWFWMILASLILSHMNGFWCG